MDISPAYTIHRYGEDVFKVVAFKRSLNPDRGFIRDREDNHRNETKLDSNFSRARSMVLQYALCNPWEYFFTGTLDREKFNRYDLDTFQTKLSQFIRDKRKAYSAKFQVLLVPEHHKDGAWHIHGLVHGLPGDVLHPFAPPAPRKLIEGGFLNWPDYMRKFGFCSLAPIRNPVATAYYISKYVSKDLARREGDLGKHLYFHSRPLKKAEKASDVYLYNTGLDNLCTRDYVFCKVGMVQDVPWYFPYVWDGAEAPGMEPLNPKPIQEAIENFQPQEIDPFYEQLKIDL